LHPFAKVSSDCAVLTKRQNFDTAKFISLGNVCRASKIKRLEDEMTSECGVFVGVVNVLLLEAVTVLIFLSNWHGEQSGTVTLSHLESALLFW
jgi:hypothetical protein